MEQTKVEQALGLIFKDGSLLRDGNNYVVQITYGKLPWGWSKELSH